jgi:hypothetical protein
MDYHAQVIGHFFQAWEIPDWRSLAYLLFVRSKGHRVIELLDPKDQVNLLNYHDFEFRLLLPYLILAVVV